MPAVGLEATANLLVAALDLNLVRLVRGAMRAADCQSGCGCGDHLIAPAARFEPRLRHEPKPVIEPRRHIHPEPRFEPRPVHRPENIEPPACPPAASPPCVEPKSPASPIQPPWKVLPWQDPPAERPRPIHKVKVVVGRPDMCAKGNVIDLFI